MNGDNNSTGTDQDTAREPTRLYTPAQAAELLALRESWLRRKAGERAIPCTFIGKHLRFSAEDLRIIVTNGAQPIRVSRRR